MFFLIVFIVSSFFFILWLLKHPNPINLKSSIIGFTGILGAGKTALAVLYTRLIYFRNCRFCRKHKLPKPQVYSNIPIKLRKGEYSCVLDNDVTLLRRSIPQYSVVLIDEVGCYASQFDYKAKNIDAFDEFVRFFRHYINGTLIVTDQCSENIVLNVRRRINTIYNLDGFHKSIFPFSTFKVRQICISEEIKSVLQVNGDDPTGFRKTFVFGNPFKWYDSRCYRIRYKDIPPKDGQPSRSDLLQPDLFKLDKS